MCPQLPSIDNCGELAKLVAEPQVSLPWWRLEELMLVSILDSISDGCVYLSHLQVEFDVWQVEFDLLCQMFIYGMCLFEFEFGQGSPRVVERASTMPASLACPPASRSRRS